jgi:hypothetical protein
MQYVPAMQGRRSKGRTTQPTMLAPQPFEARPYLRMHASVVSNMHSVSNSVRLKSSETTWINFFFFFLDKKCVCSSEVGDARVSGQYE